MSPTQIKFLAFRVYRFKDNKAYDALYVHFGRRLNRFLALKLPRSEDAEEATAEVMFRGWEYMCTSVVQDVSGLFYKIARNIVADFYRKHRPTSELDETSPWAIQSGLLIDEEVANKLEVERLRANFKRLTPEQEEALALRYFSEMSIEEISVIMQKTPNNVRVLIHRGRQALQKYEEKS